MATDLVAVRVRLRSSIASVDTALDAGTIVAVRADVAAAWIAEGLADPVEGSHAVTSAPETTMRAPGRPRLVPR